jgi:hypothetical protein
MPELPNRLNSTHDVFFSFVLPFFFFSLTLFLLFFARQIFFTDVAGVLVIIGSVFFILHIISTNSNQLSFSFNEVFVSQLQIPEEIQV